MVEIRIRAIVGIEAYLKENKFVSNHSCINLFYRSERGYDGRAVVLHKPHRFCR